MLRRLILATLLTSVLLAGSAVTSRGEREACFPETGKCISGRFLEFWEQNGGLPVFGFPITEARMEANPDTGQMVLTQWFERNRFELHPENPAPYDVLLGRLGDDRLRQLGEDWHSLAQEQGPSYGCLWFQETGHNVCGEFKNYWLNHGLQDPALDPFRQSLALFGLPISDIRLETNASGATVFTQWFERARFEWHPDNPEGFKVLLGLLGNEVSSAPPAPQPTRVVILQNHTAYRGRSTYHVVGEVQNRTAGPVHNVKVIASFFNAAGNLVGTDYSYVYLDAVEPGQRAPFHLSLLSAPQDLVRYELSIEWTRGPARGHFVRGLQITSHATRPAGFDDAAYIFGQVANTGDSPARFVKVAATLYDAQGRVVQTELGYASLDQIAPGGSSPFEILIDSWRGATRYELQVEGMRP